MTRTHGRLARSSFACARSCRGSPALTYGVAGGDINALISAVCVQAGSLVEAAMAMLSSSMSSHGLVVVGCAAVSR